MVGYLLDGVGGWTTYEIDIIFIQENYYKKAFSDVIVEYTFLTKYSFLVMGRLRDYILNKDRTASVSDKPSVFLGHYGKASYVLGVHSPAVDY